MSSRLDQIGGHLSGADDVVIVYAKRTAMTRARKGGFKDTNPEWLLAAVLKVYPHDELILKGCAGKYRDCSVLG